MRRAQTCFQRIHGAELKKLATTEPGPTSRSASATKSAGSASCAAGSAEEALTMMITNSRIDVVVADLEMPGRNGFDLVAAMRKAEWRVAALPVVGLTGTIGPEAIERARSLGIVDLVAKFDRSGLISALSEVEVAPLANAA